MTFPPCLALRAARKEFWDSKDPASWSRDEKQLLLVDSPWAQEGFARIEAEPAHDPTRRQRDAKRRHAGHQAGSRLGDRAGTDGRRDATASEARFSSSAVPGAGAMGERDTGAHGRRAGGAGIDRAVLRDPASGAAFDAAAEGPCAGRSRPIRTKACYKRSRRVTRLERKGKSSIPCNHLFTGSGDAAD